MAATFFKSVTGNPVNNWQDLKALTMAAWRSSES
jgi:hypothetical protein